MRVDVLVVLATGDTRIFVVFTPEKTDDGPATGMPHRRGRHYLAWPTLLRVRAEGQAELLRCRRLGRAKDAAVKFVKDNPEVLA